MKIAIVAAAAVLAAGCFGGLKKEVEQPLLCRIEAPRLAAGAPLVADLKVVVGPLAPGLDGRDIATRWPGNRIDYVAGARWAEELSALIESALVESLQDSGRLRSVQGDLGRFRATHTLVVEVRRFDADYTGGGCRSPMSRSRRRSGAARTGACSRRSRSPRARARPRTGSRRWWPR